MTSLRPAFFFLWCQKVVLLMLMRGCSPGIVDKENISSVINCIPVRSYRIPKSYSKVGAAEDPEGANHVAAVYSINQGGDKRLFDLDRFASNSDNMRL